MYSLSNFINLLQHTLLPNHITSLSSYGIFSLLSIIATNNYNNSSTYSLNSIDLYISSYLLLLLFFTHKHTRCILKFYQSLTTYSLDIFTKSCYLLINYTISSFLNFTKNYFKPNRSVVSSLFHFTCSTLKLFQRCINLLFTYVWTIYLNNLLKHTTYHMKALVNTSADIIDGKFKYVTICYKLN